MSYVLDSTAILVFLLGEEGAPVVQEILQTAAREKEPPVFIPFMALMEVELYLLRSLPAEAERILVLLGSWPARVVESSPQWRQRAARLRLERDLTLGQAWIAALALLQDARLVHKDPAFQGIPQLKEVKLP